MMLPLADAAVSYRLAFVDAVLDRFGRAQIREDGFQIFVGHVGEIPPWHDGIELSRADFARVNDIQEQSFVVIADARGVGRQVCAGDLREWVWCY